MGLLNKLKGLFFSTEEKPSNQPAQEAREIPEGAELVDCCAYCNADIYSTDKTRTHSHTLFHKRCFKKMMKGRMP
jgi:hypothetical protein